jgi:hypothetical protein
VTQLEIIGWCCVGLLALIWFRLFAVSPEITKTINDQLLTSTNFLAEKIVQQTELLEGFSREMHDAVRATYQVGADIEKVLAENAKSTAGQISGLQEEVIRLHDSVVELKTQLVIHDKISRS